MSGKEAFDFIVNYSTRMVRKLKGAEPNGLEVAGLVYAEAVAAMGQMRAEGNYVGMNELLDCVLSMQAELAKLAPPEMLQEVCRTVHEVDEHQPIGDLSETSNLRTKLCSLYDAFEGAPDVSQPAEPDAPDRNALSPEELRELGLG